LVGLDVISGGYVVLVDGQTHFLTTSVTPPEHRRCSISPKHTNNIGNFPFMSASKCKGKIWHIRNSCRPLQNHQLSHHLLINQEAKKEFTIMHFSTPILALVALATTASACNNYNDCPGQQVCCCTSLFFPTHHSFSSYFLINPLHFAQPLALVLLPSLERDVR
jgi:hypothetical protein